MVIKLLMEFLGTFILCLSINLSTTYFLSNQITNWLLIFAGFYTAVTWTREISGGHLNPAVTTAFFLTKKSNIDISSLLFYILSQILGAFSACLFSYFLYNGHIVNLGINSNSSQLQAFLVEILSTFFFVYTILCQSNKTSKLFMEKSASTLIIALALFASASVAGNISGGCLNPAIGIALNFSRLIIKLNSNEILYVWLYILGPLLGGICASMIYNSFYENYFSTENEDYKVDHDIRN